MSLPFRMNLLPTKIQIQWVMDGLSVVVVWSGMCCELP